MSDTDDLLQAIPLLDPKMDVRSLPLDAREGFVLSRIDGSCNVQMLAAVTGMGDDEIIGVVRKLASLKAIVFKGYKLPEATPPPTPAPTPVATTPAPGLQPVADGVDLPQEDQRRIADLHAALGKASHYDLLQVMRDAIASDIKVAYYKFSKDFHPDRFYGKRLGPYKLMLEKLFKAGKLAYETLSDPAARAQYDKTLPKSAPPPAGTFNDPEQQRRAELEAHRQKILEERKKKRNPFQDQVDRARVFAQEGETFFKQGDLVSAVARFALALSYDPLNEAYQRRHQELLPVANEMRAKALSAQAANDVSTGNFERGATLYLQAYDVNPGNGVFAFKAADLFYKQGTDLERARDAITKAITRAPKNAEYRLLAGLIYEKTGALNEAREAVKAALDLGSPDEEAKKLLKRLR